MSEGTLTLTNKSTAVTGAGTDFTTELTGADFVIVTVGGTVYSLAVESVTSGTALVLSLPFNGPTTTGVAWQAVPRKTMLRVTAELNKQVTESLRLSYENSMNWRAVLSSNDTVTVILPDGTTLTGYSWKKIVDLLGTLDIATLQPLADQIHTDAQQVATDKPIIVQAKTDAVAAASAAAQSESNASTSETNAAGSASTASTKADEAAESARQAAASNPLLALQKSLNLGDLDDRSEAWLNVRPTGATPLAADAAADGDAPRWKQVKDFIAAVRSVVASWSVVNSDATAPANGTTVKGGKVRSVYKVGTAEYASADLQASVATSSTGVRTVGAEVVVTDATSGTATSKIIKLGTVDGWKAGVIDGQNEYVKIERSLVVPGSTTFGGGIWLGFPQSSPHVKRGMDMYPQIDVADNNCHVFYRILNGNGDAVSAFAYHENGSANAYNGQWINGSDIEIKYNVQRIADPLAAMREIKGCTWNYKANGKFGIGFIAQDVEKVFPGAVTESSYPQTFPDGTSVEKVKALSAGDVAAALHHEAILKLMDEIDAMKAEIAELKAK